MFKSHLSIFILAIGFAGLAAAQDTAPPKQLVQYVRDARKTGMKDKQIQQNAVKAGWPAAAVDKAIGYVRANPAAPNESKPAEEKSAAQAPATDTPSAVAEAAQPPVKAAVREMPKDPAANSAAAPATFEQPVPPAVRILNEQPATGTAPPAAGGQPANAPATPAVNAATSAADTASIKAAAIRGVPDDYQIGAGDDLDIRVWKEPDASGSAVVRPDGKISMPLLKEVSVIGLTPTQVEKVITDQLSKLINGADVTVVVKAINSKRIYVIGAVKKEGPIPFTYRMSIMQAISEAGGLTDYAKKKKIYVLRNENGREYKLPFNYDAVLKGEHMELNIPMLAGDTLVVPK